MYKIIGADKKEYGPVSAEQLHQWISEGRANAQTRVQAVGSSDWKPLGAIPEFTDALRVHSEPPPVTIAAPVMVLTPEDIAKRDYNLDIGGCISRGWALFQNNMGRLFGGFLIVAVLSLITHGLLNWIVRHMVQQSATEGPAFVILFGYVSLIVSALVEAPLIGGFYLVLLHTIRRQPTSADGVFAGFQKKFGQLALAYLVIGFLTGLSFVPFNIIFAERVGPVLQQLQHVKPDDVADLMSQLVAVFSGTLPYFLIGFIPATYLSVSWLFTLPLIADKNLSFGAAMKLSWKMVNKHWWLVFGLAVVIGLLNVLGALCCCVGLLFTIPIGLAARMFAYETIFSGRRSQDDH